MPWFRMQLYSLNVNRSSPTPGSMGHGIPGIPGVQSCRVSMGFVDDCGSPLHLDSCRVAMRDPQQDGTHVSWGKHKLFMAFVNGSPIALVTPRLQQNSLEGCIFCICMWSGGIARALCETHMNSCCPSLIPLQAMIIWLHLLAVK